MNPNQETKETYQAHRSNQRERILEAAEKLFIQDGIDGVSISAIASAARISRRTMYQYFTDKREVAWAIFEMIVGQWSLGQNEPPDGAGYQRLESFMLRLMNLVETNREHLRFIVELDALYSRETSADRLRQISGREHPNGEDWVTTTVRQGIADGSIRADVDPTLISAALVNLLVGMNARFALLGDLIRQEYNHNALDIYREICHVFLRGLRP